MRFAGIRVFLSMLTIGCGPFGVLSAYVAQKLWEWFAVPLLHLAAPSYEKFYIVCAAVGFLRATRYVKDGDFNWNDALTGSVITPTLLLTAGFLIHVMSTGRLN